MICLQRYCRSYLFSNTYHRKVQSVAVLQAGIRGLIARRNYNRLKIEVIYGSYRFIHITTIKIS